MGEVDMKTVGGGEEDAKNWEEAGGLLKGEVGSGWGGVPETGM